MRLSCQLSPLRTMFFAAAFYLFAPTSAQAQAPYLYASIPNGTTSLIAGYSVSLDGTLTPVPGSPFTLSREGGLVTTDPTDQFLFVLNANSNTISVLSIDSSSGSLTEVPGSPVPTPAPTQEQGGGSPPSAPTSMASLAGQGGNPNYLFVTYRNGPNPFTGAIVGYQIGGSTPPLTAVAVLSLDTAPVDVAVSKQGYIYSALQLIPGSTHGNQVPGVGIVKMDSISAQLQWQNFANNNPNENVVLLNPDATVLFDAEGSRTAGVGLVESRKSAPMAQHKHHSRLYSQALMSHRPRCSLTAPDSSSTSSRAVKLRPTPSTERPVFSRCQRLPRLQHPSQSSSAILWHIRLPRTSTPCKEAARLAFSKSRTSLQVLCAS